jgi:hypothetical protein
LYTSLNITKVTKSRIGGVGILNAWGKCHQPTKVQLENLQRNHFRDLCIDEWKILNWIFMKLHCMCSTGSGSSDICTYSLV